MLCHFLTLSLWRGFSLWEVLCEADWWVTWIEGDGLLLNEIVGEDVGISCMPIVCLKGCESRCNDIIEDWSFEDAFNLDTQVFDPDHYFDLGVEEIFSGVWANDWILVSEDLYTAVVFKFGRYKVIHGFWVKIEFIVSKRE